MCPSVFLRRFGLVYYTVLTLIKRDKRLTLRRRLSPFRKRSLPFLTVDATIGNQAFSHDGCNIFPRLSYNKANNTFLNSLIERTKLKPKLNLRLKLWKGLGSPVIDVTVRNDSLLVYVLNFSGIMADRCGSVVAREID